MCVALCVQSKVEMKKKSTEFRTSFYIEKRKGVAEGNPIFVQVTYESKRLRYYPGEKCNDDNWNDEIQRIKTTPRPKNIEEVIRINALLDKIKVVVSDLFELYDKENTKPDAKRLRADIPPRLDPDFREQGEFGFFDHYRNYIENLDLSPGRILKHKTTYNKIKAFNPQTTFLMIDSEYLEKFQRHLKREGGRVRKKVDGKIEKINGKITYISVPLGKNTVISELKRFKAYINWAFKKELVKWPFSKFSIDSESYGVPVLITTDERDILFEAVIESERLCRVRDMFVLQCYLGCRVGDFIQLKRTDIINGFIQYVAAKTKDDNPRYARIPVAPRAMQIIDKYNLPSGDLVPYITDQKYNVYLKELFRLVGITRIVTVTDPKTRMAKQVPICDLASSHMARRVFVGSLYKKGVKNEIIGSMSGHALGSKAFSRYHDIDKEQQQEAIKLIE